MNKSPARVFWGAARARTRRRPEGRTTEETIEQGRPQKKTRNSRARSVQFLAADPMRNVVTGSDFALSSTDGHFYFLGAEQLLERESPWSWVGHVSCIDMLSTNEHVEIFAQLSRHRCRSCDARCWRTVRPGQHGGAAATRCLAPVTADYRIVQRCGILPGPATSMRFVGRNRQVGCDGHEWLAPNRQLGHEWLAPSRQLGHERLVRRNRRNERLGSTEQTFKRTCCLHCILAFALRAAG